MSAHQTTSPGILDAPDADRTREVLGIAAAAATLLMSFSLASYDARGGENWVGPVGNGIASALAASFGVSAWLVPVETALATNRLFTGRKTELGWATVASTLVVVVFGCALTHLLLPTVQVYGGHLAGGVIGEVMGEVMRALLGLAGAVVVAVALLLATLVLRTEVSVFELVRRTIELTQRIARRTVEIVRAFVEAWREARAIEERERRAREEALLPKIVPFDDVVVDAPDRALGESPTIDGDPENDDETTDLGVSDAADDDAEVGAVEDDVEDEDDVEASDDDVEASDDDVEASDEDDDVEASDDEAAAAEDVPAPRSTAKRASKTPDGPRIVPHAEEPKRAAPAPTHAARKREGFVLPSTSLLAKSEELGLEVDEAALRELAKRLGEKLADYGVKGRVDEIHPGPVVTMFEFEPAPGTKLTKIAGLADDLAMVLAVEKVRIVAPIPGKARVGFELPNKHRKMVYLRDVLEDDAWHRLKGGLPVAVGQDIAGKPVCYDLSKMPHLLVAGATGQGKSVGLNVMLTSLLCRKTPSEVKMIMIDPKMVELKPYAGIPHLLLPVVTDMNKAALALKWAVDEMERRYQLFADSGSKNIITYNERVEKVLAGTMSQAQLFPDRVGKVRAQGPDGEAMFLPADDERSDSMDLPPERLPYIVVVIDEFADLMMVAAKDVEACVARLAQKARAAGIHVILATQRPSVDVITGMIKANFPTRMAFRVTQREDSRTILGSMGAEHLLGMGDMLVLPPGASDLKRAHSAYISEEEVEAVCDHLRAQGKPVYDERILAPREDDEAGGGSSSSSDDPLYDRAVATVTQAGFCSISQLQRALGVGYNKAAKLVDDLERQGVVGPASAKAGGRREVLAGRL